MSDKIVDPLDFAKALADETRQKIMRLCCCQRLSVSEIVGALHVSQPTVSHHLGILRAVGLVNVQREGKQIFYILNQEKIASACCNIAENFAPDQELIVINPSE